MFHKKKNRITALTFYKYTLFDVLTQSTRRYFASLVFYVEVVQKNTSNEPNVCSCYMLNHRIWDLLSHYYFTIQILDSEIYCTALSLHRIDRIWNTRKTKTTRMKPFKNSIWPTKKSVACKSSVLQKFGSFIRTTLLLCIFAQFYSVISSITVAYFPCPYELI